MTLIWEGEVGNTLDMLRYVGVAVGWADRGQRECMHNFFGDPSWKTSNWKTEEKMESSIFDAQGPWWMDFIEGWIKWRTFLISIYSRQDLQT